MLSVCKSPVKLTSFLDVVGHNSSARQPRGDTTAGTRAFGPIPPDPSCHFGGAQRKSSRFTRDKESQVAAPED